MINVLSCFDGMSCGRLALDRAGIPVETYFSSEIDKYAMKVSANNYPDITQLGDISEIPGYISNHHIDLLMGGSPCQGFSFAGKGLNFDDPRSKLFFEFVRLKNSINPKYFLLENVLMKKEYQEIISDMLGVEPIMINSSLVSAQSRKRLYWTNIPFDGLPKDKGLVLADILEDGFVDRDKSHCLDANYFKGGNLKSYFEKHRRQLVFSPKQVGTAVDIKGHDILKRVYSPDGKSPTLNTMTGGNRHPKVVAGAWRGRYKINGVRQDHKGSVAGKTTQMLELRKDDKTNTLTTAWKDNVLAKGGAYWRKLTPIECERLQTVPDNYTAGVSNSQRYKMLGNGWTVDVITHILKGIVV